jgi:hypothetical protein
MVNMDQFGTMPPISIFTGKSSGSGELLALASERRQFGKQGLFGNLPDFRQPVYCEGQPYENGPQEHAPRERLHGIGPHEHPLNVYPFSS